MLWDYSKSPPPHPLSDFFLHCVSDLIFTFLLTIALLLFILCNSLVKKARLTGYIKLHPALFFLFIYLFNFLFFGGGGV